MARLWYALVPPYSVRVLDMLVLSMTALKTKDKADIFNQPCPYIDSSSRDKLPNLFNNIFKLCH